MKKLDFSKVMSSLSLVISIVLIFTTCNEKENNLTLEKKIKAVEQKNEKLIKEYHTKMLEEKVKQLEAERLEIKTQKE